MSLALLQLADSSFPSGSYAHSFGLEWLYTNAPVDLEAILRLRLGQTIARLELPFVREGFNAEESDALTSLDQMLDALQPVQEFREASRAIGHSLLRSAAVIQPGGRVAGALNLGIAHQPIAFGLIAREWAIDLEETLEAYAFQAVRQQLSAVQRLGKIGQAAAQQMTHRLRPAMRSAVELSLHVHVDSAGAFNPQLDLAGMKHQQQFARVFLS